MRKYHEYDNRERRKQMKQKKARKVFERRNNVTCDEFFTIATLGDIADAYLENGDIEKHNKVIERMKALERG